jgi:thioredoxin 1
VAPILEKIATDYDGKVVVAKVNTDENPEWAQRFEVRGIPTMLFVAGGKVVYQQVGAVPAGYLRQIVDKFLETVAAPAAAPATESA